MIFFGQGSWRGPFHAGISIWQKIPPPYAGIENHLLAQQLVSGRALIANRNVPMKYSPLSKSELPAWLFNETVWLWSAFFICYIYIYIYLVPDFLSPLRRAFRREFSNTTKFCCLKRTVRSRRLLQARFFKVVYTKIHFFFLEHIWKIYEYFSDFRKIIFSDM